jgi:hypothetical protein
MSKKIKASIPDDIYLKLKSDGVSVSSFVRRLLTNYYDESNLNEVHFDQECAFIRKVDLLDKTLHIDIPEYLAESLNIESRIIYRC